MGREAPQDPDFAINYIRVSNVGAIDSLELPLESKAILSIYAGNGIGKTTLLECMSLVGHLPCFPTLAAGSKIKPSLLEGAFGLLNKNLEARYKQRLDLPGLHSRGINAWAERRPPRGAPYGLVEFRLQDPVGAGGTIAYHRFFVAVHAQDFAQSDPPKLTNILSRGDFDAGISPNGQFCDDRMLGRCGLVVFDPAEQTGQTFEELLQKLAKGRNFRIVTEVAGGGASNRQEIIPGLPAHLEPRAVSYINTDLNDFGRGNDLRESPKDLLKDFGSEMSSRLRILTDKDGVFRDFNELGEICKQILRTPPSHYTDRRVVPSSFRLNNLRLRGDDVHITVDREDGETPVSIAFLSAGENEVFFITLMLLNLTRNDFLGKSIILLDEPDLHVSNAARSAFFSKMLDLAVGRSQLVLSTHSAALYRILRKRYKNSSQMTRVIFRRVVSESPKLVTELKAEYDGIYLGKVGIIHQDKESLSRLWFAMRMFFHYHKSRIASVLDLSSYFIWSALVAWAGAVAVFALLVVGALLNDSLNVENAPDLVRNVLFFGHDATQYHGATRVALMTFAVGAVAPPLSVAILRWRARTQQQKLLRRIRGTPRQ